MVAHAYAEIYSNTAHSRDPVTYFILRFGAVDALLRGHSEITTTSEEVFRKILEEQSQAGLNISDTRLPITVALEGIVQSEADEGRNGFCAAVKRIPFANYNPKLKH